MSRWSDIQLINVALAPRSHWTWNRFLDQDPATRRERGCLVVHAVDHESIPQNGWRFWRPTKGALLHARLDTLPGAEAAWRRFDRLVAWLDQRHRRSLAASGAPPKPSWWGTDPARTSERAALDRLVPLMQRRAWKILAQRGISPGERGEGQTRTGRGDASTHAAAVVFEAFAAPRTLPAGRG